MPNDTTTFAARMQALGGPEALRKLAAEHLQPAVRPRVNSHIHLPPNFSAFETTSQALDLAAQQGVGVIGVSNYYDYRVYSDFTREASNGGIFPLFGLEIITLIDELVRSGVKINDPGNPGKMYICGKGITRFHPLSDEGMRLLQVIRDNDSARMAAMTDRLAGLFASGGIETGLNAEAVKDRIVARHGCPRDAVYLQERHLAQAFQEVMFERTSASDRPAALARIFGAQPASRPDDTVGIQNEIRSRLMKAGKPAFIEETFVDFDHARRLILAMGGIPCYPTLADGTRPICPYEEPVEQLIGNLQAMGLTSAEFIPIRNTPAVLSHYVHAMRNAGLFITAGTEHNTLDLLPIEPTCLAGEPIPEDVKAIFWEGACVVAAHQYLAAQGLPGFVDEEGRPSPDYATAGERIEAFSRLGAAIIARYQQVSGARPNHALAG